MSRDVPPEFIRGSVDEIAIKEEGCYWDADAGLRVITFLEKFCRHYEGSWAGQPLKLMDFQRDFLMRLYSWKKPNGTRRFSSFYLEVPKKQGKSTQCSGMALYHCIADHEPGAKVFINGVDRSQASIIFDSAKFMAQQSPALLSRLDIIDSKKRIYHPESKSVIIANSADVESKDGLNASLVLWEELHRAKITPCGIYLSMQVQQEGNRFADQ